MNMIVFAMRQYQVGAFVFVNYFAILEIKRLRWIFSYQFYRLRQRKAVVLVIGDAKCRIEQVGGVVVGREDIQQVKLRQFIGRYVVGVRVVAYNIRRVYQYVYVMFARGFRRFERGGKFGDYVVKLVRFSNVGVGGVIVVGKRNFSRAVQGGDGFAIRLRLACGERQLFFFVLLYLRISEGVFVLIIFAIFFAVGELALVRRVVYQRYQRYRFALYQFFKQRQRGVMRQFVAQMQTVFGAVDVAFLRFFDGVDYFFQIFQSIVVVAYVVNCYGIQYGGDVVRYYQRVVVVYRRVGRLVNFRARGEEFIQIIGMQFNQFRQQLVVFVVYRFRQAVLVFGKGADFVVLYFQRIVYYFVFQYQFNVIDNYEEVFIGCRRSATLLRIVSLWKMFTMVALRVLVSRISFIIAALFLAFSEAVGSLSSRMGQSTIKSRAMLTRCCSLSENVDGVRCYRRFGTFRRVRRRAVLAAQVLRGTSVSSSGCIIIFSVEIRGMTRRNWFIQSTVVLRIFIILRVGAVIRFIYSLSCLIWI